MFHWAIKSTFENARNVSLILSNVKIQWEMSDILWLMRSLHTHTSYSMSHRSMWLMSVTWQRYHTHARARQQPGCVVLRSNKCDRNAAFLESWLVTCVKTLLVCGPRKKTMCNRFFLTCVTSCRCHHGVLKSQQVLKPEQKNRSQVFTGLPAL